MSWTMSLSGFCSLFLQTNQGSWNLHRVQQSFRCLNRLFIILSSALKYRTYSQMNIERADNSPHLIFSDIWPLITFGLWWDMGYFIFLTTGHVGLHVKLYMYFSEWILRCVSRKADPGRWGNTCAITQSPHRHIRKTRISNFSRQRHNKCYQL